MAEQLLVEGNDGESLASDPDRGTPLRGLGGRDDEREPPGIASNDKAPATVPPLPASLTSYMRRYPRHPVDWHARYVSAQGRDFDVRVFDISQSGASIEAIPGFDLGGAGRLTFTQIEGQPTIEVTVKNGARPMGRVGESACTILTPGREIGRRFDDAEGDDERQDGALRCEAEVGGRPERQHRPLEADHCAHKRVDDHQQRELLPVPSQTQCGLYRERLNPRGCVLELRQHWRAAQGCREASRRRTYRGPRCGTSD